MPRADFARGVVRRVVLRQRVVRPLAHLPAGDRRLAVGLRHEPGALHELVLVDVARAVREDLGGAHSDHELRLGILGQEGVVLVDRGHAVEPHALPALEIDEQEPHVRVDEHVPGREVHAVPVVVREGDRALVENAHEAGIAALVRGLRPAFGVGGGDEEHVPRLDERAVALVDRVADRLLLEPIGDPARVEAVLQAAATAVVQVLHAVHRGARPGRSKGALRPGTGAARARGRRGRPPRAPSGHSFRAAGGRASCA